MTGYRPARRNDAHARDSPVQSCPRRERARWVAGAGVACSTSPLRRSMCPPMLVNHRSRRAVRFAAWPGSGGGGCLQRALGLRCDGGLLQGRANRSKPAATSCPSADHPIALIEMIARGRSAVRRDHLHRGLDVCANACGIGRSIRRSRMTRCALPTRDAAPYRRHRNPSRGVVLPRHILLQRRRQRAEDSVSCLSHHARTARGALAGARPGTALCARPTKR